MNRSRAETIAELQDIGEPLGKELEYRTISGSVEAVGCLYAESLDECPEAYLALYRLRESLFWARRALGRAQVLEQAGLVQGDGIVTEVTAGAMPEGLD